MGNLRFMAYSSGQHTYEEKGEEQSRWQNTFSRGRCLYKECGGTSGRAPHGLAVRTWGRPALPWHICWRQKLVSSSNSTPFGCSGDSHRLLPHQVPSLTAVRSDLALAPSAPAGEGPLGSGWIPRRAASFLLILVVFFFKPKVTFLLLRIAGEAKPTNAADNTVSHDQWVSNLAAYRNHLGALKNLNTWTPLPVVAVNWSGGWPGHQESLQSFPGA